MTTRGKDPGIGDAMPRVRESEGKEKKGELITFNLYINLLDY